MSAYPTPLVETMTRKSLTNWLGRWNKLFCNLTVLTRQLQAKTRKQPCHGLKLVEDSVK
jgi:hypothetical protein